MTTRQQVIKYCLTFPGVYEDYPFRDSNWTCMRIRSRKRIFAWIYEREGHIWVNVKCDPRWRELWQNTYKAVIPAWHMNKMHWNTLILDGTIPVNEIKRMLAESYDLCK